MGRGPGLSLGDGHGRARGSMQEGQAFPRFGSPWEEWGAGGQVPPGGPEQMAKGIIKIQLCSQRGWAWKRGEAAGAKPRLGHCPSLWRRFLCHSQDVKSSLNNERLPVYRPRSPELSTPDLRGAEGSKISCLTSRTRGH